MNHTTSPGSKARRLLQRSRLLVLTFVLLFVAFAAEASHFRYGNISWSLVSGRTVQFKVSQAYRRSFSTAYTNAIVGSVINVGTLQYSDASTASTINLVITSINPAEDWIYGEVTITKTFTTDGVKTAFFSSSARLSSLKNNADLAYRQEVKVTVGTTYNFNSGPVSGMPPTVNVPFGRSAATFQLAANDPDGNALTYRFATPTEMGGSTETQPASMSVSSSGLVTFNTSTTNAGMAIGNLYSAAFVVTDTYGASTMIDLMVKIVQPSTPPVFNYSITPVNGMAYDIQPGQNVAFSVRASDPDAGDIVVLSAVGLPSGAVISPGLPTSGNPAGTSFSWTPTQAQLGSRVISFTAQDNFGNQTTTNVNILVSMNPVFDVPPTPAAGTEQVLVPGSGYNWTIQAHAPDASVNLSIVSASLPASVSALSPLPSASGNSSSLSLQWTPAASDWGEHSFSFTATDNLNKSKTHSFDVLVNSTPEFQLPLHEASVSVPENSPYSFNFTATDADVPYGDELDLVALNLPSWLTFTVTGPGTGTLSGTPPVGSAGTYQLSVIAEDIHHHDHAEVRQDFSITVLPCNINPGIQASQLTTCPNNPVTLSASGADSYVWSNGATGATILVSQSGTYTVTGSSNGCSGTSGPVTITVVDNSAPVPTVPVLPTLTGECSVTASAPTANDECSGLVVATTSDPVGYSTQGTYTIHWTFTDASGNTAQQDQTVIVKDVTPPVISCAFNVTVNAAPNSCGATVSYNAPSATDNCGNGSLPTSLDGYTYKGTYGGHTYFISNSPTTPEDAHARAIALGGHLVTISDAQENAFVSAMSPNFIWIGHTDREVEGTFKWVTSEPVTYTNWNSGEPNNYGGNEDWAVINWGPNGTWNDWFYYENALFVVEFEGGNIPTHLVSGLGSGATFPVGTTTETWEAVDAGGNRATCSFTVTVVDTQAPSIVGLPANITVGNDANVCGARVSWSEPVSADNCSSHSISRIGGPASGSIFPVGITTVTYRAQDAAGNASTGSFTVRVNDTQAPSIVCISNRSINLLANCTVAIPDYRGQLQVSDNCPGTLQVVQSPAAGTLLSGTGTQLVTFTVTDAHNNVNSCSFRLTKRDITRPTITVPAPVTVTAPAGSCSIPASSVTLGEAVGSDACSLVTISSTVPATFPVGSTPVLYLATDASGNAVQGVQIVTVVSMDAPVIAATPAITVSNDAGACGAAVTVATPKAAAFCANNECRSANMDGFSTGEVSGQSTYFTPWPGGSSALVSAAQSFSAPYSMQVSNDQDQLYMLGDKTTGKWELTWKMYVPADRFAYYNLQKFANSIGTEFGYEVRFFSNGSGAARTPAGTASFSFPHGQWFDVRQSIDLDANTTTLYVAGNAVQSWTLSDRIGPVNAPGTKQLGAIDFFGGIDAVDPAAPEYYVDDIRFCGSNDAIVSGSRSDNAALSAAYPVGTTSITWKAVGGNGQVATSTQAITVNDTEAPVVTAPVVPSVYCNAATYTVPLPTYSDNCGIASVSYRISGATTRNGNGANASGSFQVGTSVITWTVTDIHGNSSTASASILVNAPVSGNVADVWAVSAGGQANTIYQGYGPAALSLGVTPSGGTAPYSYQWSNGATTASVSVGAGTWNVVVKDAYGCVSAAITKVIKLVDVRCGNKLDKVLVCHNTGSGSNPWVQVCVAPAAVATQLGNGGYLGACTSNAVTRQLPKVQPTLVPALSAYPNPSRGIVQLRVSGLQGKLRVEVLDSRGSRVLQHDQTVTYQSEDLTLNLQTAAAGLYTVRVSNGDTVLTTRIVIAR
ncbi:HYR domain-containing protein [Flaviaesturariibacter terrae]